MSGDVLNDAAVVPVEWCGVCSVVSVWYSVVFGVFCGVLWCLW